MMQTNIFDSINQTDKNYPDITLSEFILQECKIYQSQVAIIDYEKKITYKELGHVILQIASNLQGFHLEPRSAVIVLGDRSFELIATAAAVMHCGGIYVPVDISYPAKRIEYMIKNTGASMVIDLTREVITRKIKGLENIRYTYSEIVGNQNEKEPLMSKIQNTDSTAYIIYTSGTTGKPKGVAVSHKAIMNTLFWLSEQFLLNQKDVIAFKTSIGFTDSIWEMFWPLLNGAKLSIIKNEDAKSISFLYKWFEREQISYTQFVPSMMKVFLEYIEEQEIEKPLPNLSWVFNGGEHISIDLVKKFNDCFEKARIADIYGMTESAIYATYYLIEKELNEKWDETPIGIPIANTKVYLYREDGTLCTQNEMGEICISGISMAKGYWKDEESTARKFVKTDDGQVRYHTGDLGMIDDSGVLWYCGRIDGQVKIRGNRVEINEVEKVLHNIPSIGQVAVIAQKNHYGETILICFLDNEEKAFADIRTYLREILPEYMVPQKYYYVKEMPLSVNNKIDRTKLQEMYSYFMENKEKEEDKEDLLYTIWKNVLDLDEFSGQDDFFDIGGDSIGLARVQIELEKQGYAVSYEQLMSNRTFEKMRAL
ncbi:non-ribosomal peptide synthetase [[Clostridium] polysaccharolyticum]|uniref:Amino acid adenylation domain-containing protein n=1 Tax=[Clostridium] polysaccharolyticum TaxID=29364 RepID=A0A1I0C496_9FIRM|nr:non-ribosomal peptide synthetase [[Clostridium] polysaccharolyticum]SET14252.1 amino acid adenylation domain-containing protein [[Clostridium] polysaccharolyticum]